MNQRQAKRQRRDAAEVAWQAECAGWVQRQLTAARIHFERHPEARSWSHVDRELFDDAMAGYAAALHSWVRNPVGQPSFVLGCRSTAKKHQRDLRGVKRRRSRLYGRLLTNVTPGNRGGRLLDPKRHSPGCANRHRWIGLELEAPPPRRGAPPRRAELSDEQKATLIPPGSWSPARPSSRRERPVSAEELERARRYAEETGFQSLPLRLQRALTDQPPE